MLGFEEILVTDEMMKTITNSEMHCNNKFGSIRKCIPANNLNYIVIHTSLFKHAYELHAFDFYSFFCCWYLLCDLRLYFLYFDCKRKF